MAYYQEYAWLIVAGAFVAFFMAYGIGANDVANAFATSVGSKTLTLFQAVILAGIFEFAGALLLGRGVTDTVRKGITKLDAFEDAPEILMYGMFCALLGSAIWLIVATYFEMPVSTTHSIIGGIVGMALVAYGRDAVVWHAIDRKKDFPVKGISSVVISWVFSPVASGIVAAVFFLLARTFVLRSQDSFNRTFIFLPVLIGVAIFINGFYVLDKGKFGKLFKEGGLTTETCAWVAAVIAAICIIATIPFSMWLKKRSIDRHEGKDLENPAEKSSSGDGNFFSRMAAAINSQDPHSAVEEDQATKDIHDNAEVFDERTEDAFRYLQVLTACCDSFAHGANDVANSVGPFSAMWHVYTKQALTKKSDVPVWILVTGGAGIVVGLATYGYSIIKAIGVKLTKITPSRGFCIEMGSALIVVTGSYLGLPLSTTHCQVGATAFVGLLEGASGISYSVLGKTVFGWIFTLIIVGFISAILMVLGIRTPNLRTSHGLNDVEGVIADFGREKAVALNTCTGRSPDAENAFYFFKHFTMYYRYPDRVGSATAYMEDLTVKNCTFVAPAAFEVLDSDGEVEFTLKDVAPGFIEHGKDIEVTETKDYYDEITDLLDGFSACEGALPNSEAFAKSIVQEDGMEDGKTKYKGRLLFPKSKESLKAAKDFVTFLEGDDEEVELDKSNCAAIDAQAPDAVVLP